MFEDIGDADLVSAIGDAAGAENTACARRLAAIAELCRRRHAADGDGRRERWRIDPWEAVAAEVAAAQGITAAAAAAQLHNAISLHERLPKVAALFATGALSYRLVHLIINRTLLAFDPDILAAIDTDLAHTLTTWGPLSLTKTEHAIDALVQRHDPDARRCTESMVRSRFIDIEHRGDGIAAMRGDVQSSDATLLDRRLTALAHTVCAGDPRTLDQRRADAVGALAAGHTVLACACGQPDCTADENPAPAPVVVHVVAEAAALDAATGADLHGERPGDGGPNSCATRSVSPNSSPRPPRPAPPRRAPRRRVRHPHQD